MRNGKRGRYTLEFKQEAVRLVESGQTLARHSGARRQFIQMITSTCPSHPTTLFPPMNIAAAVNVRQWLIPAVKALHDAIAEKVAEWSNIVKIGRTHMQDATPLTLGQEWSGYEDVLADDLDRLEDGLKNVYRLALGGTAVGTGLNSAPGFGEAAAAEIAELTGLPFRQRPTEHAECTPEQAYTWSKGKAIYAAGVQFGPVHFNGQTFLPGQANNFYIFPAAGMAIFATQAKRVTDAMFIEAGQAVADQVPSDLLQQGLLYPLQSNILETEIQTAARVAKLVFDAGLARVERPADMVAFIRKHVYKPEYSNLAVQADRAA